MTKHKEGEGKTNKLLSGKTAIVTGASSGIGRATALTLAQAGGGDSRPTQRQAYQIGRRYSGTRL
jgi:NADP-dependent 3-hydroxy acid dehydrogenase YdfG